MKISENDKKVLMREYSDKMALKHELKNREKKHHEQRVRDNLEKNKIFEERRRALVTHEEEGVAKKLARQKEVDNRQVFLKLSSALNII